MKENAKLVSGRFVLNHEWDAEDSRLVFCEAKLQPKEKKSQGYGRKPVKVDTKVLFYILVF